MTLTSSPPIDRAALISFAQTEIATLRERQRKSGLSTADRVDVELKLAQMEAYVRGLEFEQAEDDRRERQRAAELAAEEARQSLLNDLAAAETKRQEHEQAERDDEIRMRQCIDAFISALDSALDHGVAIRAQRQRENELLAKLGDPSRPDLNEEAYRVRRAASLHVCQQLWSVLLPGSVGAVADDLVASCALAIGENKEEQA